jgi:hypothetical protein
MPASMPRRWMKASIALLRPLALLFMMFIFFGDGLGENLAVDQIEIPAHAPQVADRGSHCSFESPVVLDNDVGADPDLPIGVRKFNRSPWRLEPSRDPVVMQVKAVVICEMTPISDNLVSRLT